MGATKLCKLWPVVVWALIYFQNTTWYNAFLPSQDNAKRNDDIAYSFSSKSS